jgi:hypothetical protein
MSFLQDTAFGVGLRFLSRGKLLEWKENIDEETQLRYLAQDSRRSSDAMSPESKEVKGIKLIEFLENDPQVRIQLHLLGTILYY